MSSHWPFTIGTGVLFAAAETMGPAIIAMIEGVAVAKWRMAGFRLELTLEGYNLGVG